MSQSMQSPARNLHIPAGRGMITQHSREHLRHEVDHLCHMLSEQGPISVTFVHNNTLLGWQKLHFEAAIARAKEFIGGQGYLPNADYRSHSASGRIAARDLDRVMAGRKDQVLDTVLAKAPDSAGGAAITSGQVMRLHLTRGIDAVPACELRFAAEEDRATRKFRADLPTGARKILLQSATTDLARARARIGVDQTLAGWLQGHFNVDLLGHIRRDVTDGLLADRQASQSPMETIRDLRVLPEHWVSYQALVAALVQNLAPAQSIDQAIGLWLEAQQQAVSRHVRRHFDIGGDLDSLSVHFKTNLEEYAAMGLWAAALARFGLRDPFSPLDAFNLSGPRRQHRACRGNCRAIPCDGTLGRAIGAAGRWPAGRNRRPGEGRTRWAGGNRNPAAGCRGPGASVLDRPARSGRDPAEPARVRGAGDVAILRRDLIGLMEGAHSDLRTGLPNR